MQREINIKINLRRIYCLNCISSKKVVFLCNTCISCLYLTITIWLETMLAEFPTRFQRLFAGPMWSGTAKKDMRDPLKEAALDGLKESNPDGRFWLKLDGTDVKACLMESVKGAWNGDVDLGDSKLETLHLDYERRQQVFEVMKKSEGRSILEEALRQRLDELQADGALAFTQEPPKYVYFMKGQDAVLIWNYTYSAENRSAEIEYIIWYAGTDLLMYEDNSGKLHLGNPMPLGYAGRVQIEKPATLIIKTLTYKDTRSYACSLRLGRGLRDLTSVTTLIVTGVEPRVHVAEVGDSVTFTCIAKYFPSSNLNWMTRLPRETIVSDAKRTIVSNSGSSQLTIINITNADQGFYDCVATIGSHQQVFGSGYLQLPKGVTMCTKEVYRVRVGSRLSLSCSPDSGFPTPIVTWERNGTLLQKEQNNMYTITNVTEEDFGNYTCIAAGLDTSAGPCSKSVVAEKVDEFVVEKEPSKLAWAALAGAEYYVVQISGNDILDDVMVGTQTSLEFHYHTLVMKNDQHQPEQTVIRAKVLAINNNQVIGKTPYQEFTIKKPIDVEN